MRRATSWIPLVGIVSQLWRDVSGISLIYVTVALPALMGCMLLAIDVGRVWSLQSSLQHAADSLALAVAGELDRQPDAISRATNAKNNLVGNPTIFATGIATIDGSSVTARYLKSLPASDASPIEAADVTTDPMEARYVEITVNPVTFKTVFPATFVGAAANTLEVSATAIAGFDAVVCDFTPLFMCNPYEPATGITDPLPDYGLYSHVESIASKRRLISFKPRDSERWRPGDYGFLAIQPNEHIGNLLASVNPKACFSLNRLFTQRSHEDDARRALNVRFDLYEDGRYSEHPPGVNVRKGYIVKQFDNFNAANTCNDNHPISKHELSDYYEQNGVMGLPRDSDCAAGCPQGSGRMGNGDWGGDVSSSDQSTPDFEQYWTTNFNAPLPIISGIQRSNTYLPSRYETYRQEIGDNLQSTSRSKVIFYGSANEYREPRQNNAWCSPLPPVDNPDRRIVYGAIINCRAVEMSGREGGPYQGVAFGKFFMTEPVSEDGTLWAEFVDIVRPENSTNTRDMVQLYR